MTALLIKNFPPELHRKLKEEATRYHRSMTRQAITLLEHALANSARNTVDVLPEPIKLATPIKVQDVVTTIRETRESDVLQ